MSCLSWGAGEVDDLWFSGEAIGVMKGGGGLVA